MNILLQRLTQRGTLTGRQERALISFVTNLGKKKFSEYRQAARVGNTPITKLSRSEAWKLISEIVSGEGLNDDQR